MEKLPPSLEFLSDASCSDLAALPRSVKKLAIPALFSSWQPYFQSAFPEEGFPPTLESLELYDFHTLPPGWTRMLPLSLRRLYLLPSAIGDPFLDALKPLQHLELNALYISCEDTATTQSVSMIHLPKTLTSLVLDFSPYSWEDKDLQHLPPKLQYLNLGGSTRRITKKVTSFLPKSLENLSIGVVPFSWPEDSPDIQTSKRK